MSEPSAEPPRNDVLSQLMSAPVTSALFTACLIVFALASREGSTQTTDILLRFGANDRSDVWHGQYWRLFTSMFLHIGVVHLVWNLWAGFSWSAPFERAVGPWRFLVIYLLSGLVGSAASVIGHDVVSAGASGALFGVIGGTVVLLRARLGSWRALWNEPGPQRMLLTTVLWLAIGPFVGFDSFAHGGGMVAGMALTWGFLPRKQNVLAVAVFGCALAIGAATRPLPVLHDGWLDARALDAAWKRRDWAAVAANTEQVKPGDRVAPFRAEALLNLGRTAEAVTLLPATSEVVDDAPWLASLWRRAGQPERGLSCLRAALDAAPKDLELEWALLSLADDLHDSKTLDEAMRLLVRDHPDSWQGKVARGRTLLAADERDEALTLLAEAASSNSAARADYVLALVGAGRRQEAREAIGDSPIAGWLQCWVSSVDGDFTSNQAVCESLDDSESSRSAKAFRLVGAGDCDGALRVLGTPTDFTGRTLVTVCALRSKPETAESLERARQAMKPTDVLEVRLLLFGQSHDLADLRGADEQAKNSWLWPLLPDEAKRVLPR